MSDNWKCRGCGGTAYEHSLEASTCIWDPISSQQWAPSDIALLAASNAYMHYRPPYETLDEFSAQFLDDMRSALIASWEAE